MSDDWMGMSTRPGGALVAPGLLQTVFRKQAKKNAIAKERRKAAEERRLRSRHGGGTMVQLGHTRTSPARAQVKARPRVTQEDILISDRLCVFS